MKFLIFIPLLFTSIYACFSQNTSFPDTVKSVKDLSFMEGDWKGEGWIIGQDRVKKRFVQSESIHPKVGKQVLQVEGLGYGIDSSGNITDRVIHDAFGIISYNTELKAVTMISFSGKNDRMETAMMSVGDKRLQWSFGNESSGSIIRFKEDFSKEGVWKEVGEFSRNGTDWYPFFEMILMKQ